MAIYFKDKEITNIDSLILQTGLDITDIWFGNTNVYTVWQTYEGTLPATLNANGDDMRQYQVYGAAGGAGEEADITGLSEPLCGIGTYTDSLDLSTGILTRRIRKLVLTGNETFTKNRNSETDYLYYVGRGTLLPSSISKTPIVCSHLLEVASAPEGKNVGISTNNNFSVVYVNFGANVMNAQASGNTPDGLKEYLAAQYAAGTPVTIWYVLAALEVSTITIPSGLAGTIEGYLIQDGTPTPETPIYPTANGVKQTDDTYSINGYKLDMEIYGNIWEKNVEQGGIMATGDTSDSRLRVRSYISVEEGQQYKIEINEKIRVLYAFYYNNGTLSKISGVYNGTGTISEYTFTVPTGANVIGVSMQKSDNTDILPSEVTTKICKKLPATTTPIYIGDTPLEKDEYIDYQAGKVFRRTENIFNIDKLWAYEQNYVSETGEITRYLKLFVNNGTYTVGTNVPNNENPNIASVFVIVNENALPTSANNGVFLNRPRTVTVDNGYLIIYVRIKSASGYLVFDADTFAPYYINTVVGSTVPSTEIPYLQPTDPPAPLPALPTCEGTTIVDYAGQSHAVPEKVFLKYRKKNF